jgi:hypothetical protein
MTNQQALYSEIKPGIEAVASPLFELSKRFIQTQGDFSPHAAVLTNAGKMELVGAQGVQTGAVV